MDEPSKQCHALHGEFKLSRGQAEIRVWKTGRLMNAIAHAHERPYGASLIMHLQYDSLNYVVENILPRTI